MRSSDNWKQVALGDCAEWLSGGTPSKRSPEFWGSDIPWVTSKELHSRFIDDAEFKLTGLGVAKGSRTVPPEASLLVVRSMALQNGMMIGLTRRTVAFNQDVKGLIARPEIDPHFLYYSLWGNEHKLNALVDEASHGTKRLNTDQLQAFKIGVPDLKEQRRIARVFKAFDDKIANNRRLANTLEEIATALFRARFIDFVGHDDFVESEIGLIPRGWSATSVGDLARYVNGKAFTKFGNGQGRMVIRIAELRSGPGGSTVYTDHEAEPDFMAVPGSILFAWSGSLDVYRWFGSEALINQHIFKVIPEGYPGWFVFHALKYVMPHFQAIAADKATTMGHIKRADLHSFSVAVPPAPDLGEHDAVLAPLFERAFAAHRESEALAKVRDRLLPRLISGQIRIPPDVELASEVA